MAIVTVNRNNIYVPLWNDHNRFNVLIGGAGAGKSVAVAQRFIDRFSTEPGHNVLIARKVGKTNRYSTFSLLKKVIADYGIRNKVSIRETDMAIVGPFGNTMIFEGLDDIEKIKSLTFESGPLTDVWIEEANEASREDFQQLNLRLRGQAKQPFQMTLTFNPVSVLSWIKPEFFDNPKPNATILKTTYLDNRFIDVDYKAELEAMRISDPIYYQVYALGDWGQLGDQAFPAVVYEPCKYKVSDFDSVVWGMDFGFQHYHSIEGIGFKDGEIYSFAELYVRQMTNADIIGMNGNANILPKPSLCVADSAEPKSIEEWKRSGYRIEGAKKGPDSVKSQFAYLRAHKWHIDEVACPGLAAEVRGAIYKKDKQGNATEEIFSFHDDALASCRYAIESLITPPPKYEVW
jgi:phage terminase large subunit